MLGAVYDEEYIIYIPSRRYPIRYKGENAAFSDWETLECGEAERGSKLYRMRRICDGDGYTEEQWWVWEGFPVRDGVVSPGLFVRIQQPRWT